MCFIGSRNVPYITVLVNYLKILTRRCIVAIRIGWSAVYIPGETADPLRETSGIG